MITLLRIAATLHKKGDVIKRIITSRQYLCTEKGKATDYDECTEWEHAGNSTVTKTFWCYRVIAAVPISEKGIGIVYREIDNDSQEFLEGMHQEFQRVLQYVGDMYFNYTFYTNSWLNEDGEIEWEHKPLGIIYNLGIHNDHLK